MSDTAATTTPMTTPQTSAIPSPEAPAAASPAAIAAVLKLKLHKTGYGGANGLFATLLLSFLKVFRLNIAAQSDFPCALTLAPFETDPATLPPKAIEAVSPMVQTLERLGFTQPLWHQLPHAMGMADTILVHMLHPSGQSVARITCHLLRIKKQPVAFVQFFSEVSGGQLLLTWPRGFELATPPDWVVHKVPKASITELYAAHRKKLIEVAGAKPIATCTTADSMRDFMQRRQVQLMQLQVQRGICIPLTPAEQQRLSKRIIYSKLAHNVSGEHADVISEIARIQESTTNWGATIFILILSLAAFIAAGASVSKWEFSFLVILVGVLFVHELGHYFAMRLSGYRNLKMFFIPFLGAAVSGQSYNVPGWKKTIVSLMGPVPGIILAIPLGIVALAFGYKMLMMIALTSLLINALNLLPIVPLDGGWVLHHVLFSRKVYLEIIFRIVAVGLLLLISLATADKFLMWFAIAVAVQIPLAFKQAQIVARLRQANFVPVSHDDQTIPPDAAVPIIERVKEAFPRNLTTRAAATHTIAVFDRLNSRPPGWVASILFLFFHGACFVVALLCGVIFLAGKDGGFRSIANTGRNLRNLASLRANAELKQQVSLDTIVTLTPPPAGVVPITLSANYRNHAAALEAARRIKPAAPSDSGFLVFGQTLLVSLSRDDDALRERLFAAVSDGSTDARVRRPDQGCSLMLQFDVPPNSEKHPAITELMAFLTAPSRNRDYAPWDTTNPRTPEANARIAAILKIRAAILQPTQDPLDDKALQDFARKFEEASRKGDRAAMRKLMDEQAAARKESLLKRLAQLAQDNPDHVKLIDAVRESVTRSGDAALYKDLDALIEPYLDLMPKGSPNPMGVSYGSAYAFGKSAIIELYLISPEHSAPEMVRWLQERGLDKPRYRLSVYETSTMEELMERE